MAQKRTLPVSVKIFIFTLAAIGVVLLTGLLPISIIRSHHIHNEWSKYADRFVKARALSQSMNSPAAIAKYNDHSLLQVRIYPLGADINKLTRDQADKTIIFSDISMPVSRHVVTQNTGFSQIMDTARMIISLVNDPLELVSYIDGQLVGFTIDQSTIYHDTLHRAPMVILLVMLASLPALGAAFWLHRRFHQHPMRDLLDTLMLIADDPTVIQTVPKSLQKTGEMQRVGAAVESLQRNMLRAYRQRERLADIGEVVAKINHDIRNVLSSATLVSDALMQSDDINVRRSAPLVMQSLEQAVDLCQSMLDYLAQTPTPQWEEFDLAALLVEIRQASLLTLHYKGPQMMHADRGMMRRIFLNLARNAGTAGATDLWVEVWQVGHLALVDISDNGHGIARDNWATLFSPFKSRQGGGGGLGLAISRDLAVAHGGMLRLSRSNRDGSEFRIQFPTSVFPGLGQKQIGPWQELPATAPVVDSAVITSGSAALADDRG